MTVCLNIDGDLVTWASMPTEAEISAWRELRKAMQAKLDAELTPEVVERQTAAAERRHERLTRIRDQHDDGPMNHASGLYS